MSDVFISYSRKDKEFVHILHDALEAAQKNTWVDWEDILPTAEWLQEIKSAIEGADTFIFVISPDSIISKNCREEIEHAVLCHKRILAIVRREVGGDTEIHADLSRHEWIFFRQSDDFDTAFQKLREALNLDIDRIHAHTRLLVKASDWDSKQRKDSFLLRGEDLIEAEKWLTESVGKSPKPIELQVIYIENSRKVETANELANQILKKAARNAILIAVVAGALGIGGIVGSGFTAKSLVEVVIQNYKNKTERSEDKAKEAEKKAILAEEKATKITEVRVKEAEEKAKKEIESKTKEVEKKATETIESKVKEAEGKAKEETARRIKSLENIANQRESDLKACIVTNKDTQQAGNEIIYIQVPSEAVKTKTQPLPKALTDRGYKTYKTEVVGLAISPSSAQIRYFFNDEKTKERAIKLQQQLNDLGYKDFEPNQVKYVKGFEDKVKPEMMEIWFGKDAK